MPLYFTRRQRARKRGAVSASVPFEGLCLAAVVPPYFTMVELCHSMLFGLVMLRESLQEEEQAESPKVNAAWLLHLPSPVFLLAIVTWGVRIRFAYAACSCFCFRESKSSRVLIAGDFGQSEKSALDTLGLSFACRDLKSEFNPLRIDLI
ncbi:uncharacterized protein DS421_11g327290 [Arachis hypogaea]|nr:uncharacterized protein DS421_11g327290 [Arachis hypogaea]